jgi:cytosine/adenosine deaminase-related metal-dependent hydrolase
VRTFAAVSLFGPTLGAQQRRPADVLITGGTIITMDATRRVIDDGAVAIVKDRIVAVGSSKEIGAAWRGRQVIDAKRKVIMPGLIDGHGHAGHTLVKSLGVDTKQWYDATEKIYARGSTVDFWRADALLAATERLRFGVTTSFNLFGGGDNVTRTDSVKYGDAYMSAVEQVGLRWFFAVGPRRAPFPRTYVEWTGDVPHEYPVSFAQQMAVSDSLIRKWNGAGNGRLHMAVVFPTHNPATTPLTPEGMEELRQESAAARALSKKYNVMFAQDGHTRGTVRASADLGLLGPDALLSHATDLTDEEIGLIAKSGTKIVHNPSSVFSIRARNPTTELIDAGVTVMLGSDGTAPDRSYDMFRHMFQAMRYHRFFFRDADVLPAGKVLEMVTIDAAKALGLEKEIGSLEAGKKADIILVDMFRPHLMPFSMPLYRIAYFANGNDVSTVMVDGRVLMRDRKVLSVDETKVLMMAQREADAAIKRTGLEKLTETPPGFWGRTHLPK